MSTNFSYGVPPKRRLPPDEFQLRPAVGPDIQPAPIAQPWIDMEKRDENMGPLFGMGFQRLLSRGGSGLKGANNIEASGKYLGPMGRGGVLRRAGDTAVVGDEGPELAVREADGKTRIFPFDQNGTLAAADDPQTQPPPQPATLIAAAQGQNQPIRPEDSNVLAAATSPVPPTPLLTRPASEFQSVSVPMTGHPQSRNMPASGEEEENDARVQAAIDNAGGFAEMGGSEVRPKFANPTGRLQNQIQYERDNPAHTEQGRSIWRKLRDVGESTLIGMGSAPQGSSLGERIGYGAGFGAVGAVNPDMLPQFRQKQRVAKWGGELAAAQEQDEARIERAGKVAAVNKTNAEIYKTLNPSPDYERVETPEGYVYVDKKNPSGTAVQTGLKAPVKAGARPQTIRLKNDDGSEKIVERGADGVWRDTGLKSAGQPRRQIKVGGEVFELPESEAARVLAQIESANIGAGAKAGENAADAANANADREYKATLAARELEGGRVSDYNSLKDQLDDAFSAVRAIEQIPEDKRTQQQKIDYAETLDKYNRLKRQAQAAHDALSPDFVEFRPDERARLKPQPAPPKVQARPAPAKRTGGPVSKYTEADVRQRAQKAGKDPDAAVKAARDSGLIN